MAKDFNINLKSFDSLMADENTIINIQLDKLHTFKSHPFKVLDDDKLKDLADSIKENGVLNPALVRENVAGEYELISGHRRKAACKIAGITEMPCIVKKLTDDEAIILMVDSNLQREEILPSEKAFSYKMKLEAMKRQGSRSDLTSSQVGTKLRADEQLADETGESRSQIHRYIRLTSLTPAMLDMVDNKQLAFNVAYELSFLTTDELNTLSDLITKDGMPIPNANQALIFKAYSTEQKLTKDFMIVTLTEKAEKPKKVNLTAKTLREYFPPSYTSEQMQDVILELLAEWKNKNN